jgi:dTDP-4-dehydrorhamnose 3,5-epimerase
MGAIEGVTLTPLKIIEGGTGNVLHAMKAGESSFAGFGEAYFSTVLKDAVKGWKKHRQMILNIIVPVGSIHFVLFDDRSGSQSYRELQEIYLSKQNYQRLTVPPGVWMAFRGIDEQNMLLNIASIKHDPAEAENLPLQNPLIDYHFKAV